ncbi:MAG: hypothetical protein ACR2PL_10405 [Dehalococcoidia bacterium]
MAEMTEASRRQVWAKIESRAWTDQSYKQRVLSEPKPILAEAGLPLGDNYHVRVVEEGSEGGGAAGFTMRESSPGIYEVTMRLHKKPASVSQGELSDAQLESVAGGDSGQFCCCCSCPCCCCT